MNSGEWSALDWDVREVLLGLVEHILGDECQDVDDAQDQAAMKIQVLTKRAIGGSE